MRRTEHRGQGTDEGNPQSEIRTPCTRGATRNRWAQAPKSNGFTLIETIMTLVVLGIAAVGVLSVFTTGIRGSANPLLLDQAVQLAQGELDAVIGIKLASGFSAAALNTGTGLACKTNPMLAGFTCSLDICYVAAGTLDNTTVPGCGSSTSYKRVAVTITNTAVVNITAATLITNY
jgi:prepilin-type N-terminal cleavage/methylation domain-containing protein